MIARLAAVVTGRRARWWVIGGWVVLALALAALQPRLQDAASNENESFLSGSAESTRVNDLIDERFELGREVTAIVAFTRGDGPLTDADFQRIDADMRALCADRAIPDLKSIVTPRGIACGDLDASLAPETPPAQVSEDSSTALVSVATTNEDTGAVVDDVATLRARLPGPDGTGLQSRVTGEAGFTADASEAYEGIDRTLLAITLVLVLVLLLATYRSPVLACVPLLVVGLAYVVAAGVVYGLLQAGAFRVTGQSTAILIVLMFGAGTDYCLLLVSRYREELRAGAGSDAGAGADTGAAIAAATARSGRAIVSAGATVPSTRRSPASRSRSSRPSAAAAVATAATAARGATAAARAARAAEAATATGARAAIATPSAASALPEHRLTTLDSGLRVVTEAMPSVRSAALGFFVGAGSRGERGEEAGLSHFLEHMLFRGTDRFASAEIDQLFDAMGAELNAGTDKEGTTVYARMLDQHLPRAFDVIADMVWRPAFNDVDPEREVVLEEIAMYEDDPQDTVFDVLGDAVFGDHPLGRPIIGRAPVIRDTPVSDIAAFHARRYVPASVVIAAAGSVDHDRVVELAERTLAGLRAGERAPVPDAAPVRPAAQVRFQAKETEQVHVCLGATGLARRDERRHALRVLDAIFGGLSSSRLFQSVREERGLAYAVYSFAGQFTDSGQIGLYVGTRPDKVGEAMDVVRAELERLREQPATAEELARARENVKARVVLALESSAARMNRLGGATLYDLPLLDTDALMAKIDAVTLDDLRGLVDELWAPERLSAAGIGPSQEAFSEAVAPVCPAAAPVPA